MILLLLAALSTAPAPPAEVLAHSVPPVGAMNPAVNQSNIDSTICRHGYTATIRPTVARTSLLKRELFRRLGILHPTPAQLRSVEGDHAKPMEAGGDNAGEADLDVALRNFWLQPWDGPWGAHAKDVWENSWHRMICSHQRTLAEFEAAYAQWRAGYIAQMPH